jgi:hypothetical protein
MTAENDRRRTTLPTFDADVLLRRPESSQTPKISITGNTERGANMRILKEKEELKTVRIDLNQNSKQKAEAEAKRQAERRLQAKIDGDWRTDGGQNAD